MVSNRIILGTVAFSVSFGINLVTYRNVNQALLTGLTTLPATYIAALVVDKRRRNNELLVLGSRRQQIQQLEAHETGIHQFFSTASSQRQELLKNLNSLRTELNHLNYQVLEYRHQKAALQSELTTLTTQKHQLEADLSNYQAQSQEIEQYQAKLTHFLATVTAEKNELEANLISLHATVDEYIQENQAQQQQNNHLLTDAHKLENEISDLKIKQAEIKQDILTKRNEQQQLTASINNLHAEQNQLRQVTDTNFQQQQLELNLQTLQTQIQQLERDLVDKRTETQHLETNLKALAQEKDNVRSQIIEQQHQQQSLIENIADLTAEKQQFQLNSHILQEQLQEQILALQEQRDQLQEQILALHQPELANDFNDTQSDTELFPFAELIDFDNEPDLPPKWIKFRNQLPSYELQVLQAIIEQKNPQTTLKKIAEEHLTMPTVLIDDINKRASNTIGDLIIQPGSEPPTVSAAHLNHVKKVIALN